RRIDRPIEKRYLVIVGVVERLRQRVRRADLVAVGIAFLNTQEEPVILGLDTRLQVDHAVRAADNGIEDASNRPADDEMRPEVMQVIGLDYEVASKFTLNSEVALLNHRVLKVVVDDVYAGSPSAWKRESSEWI